MRKIVIFLLFLCSLISCTKHEFEDNTVLDNTGIISFSTVGGTKTSIETNTIPENTYFGVYGYILTNASNKSRLLNNAKYNNHGVSSSKHYWPYTNTTFTSNFIAYYPYLSAGVTESDDVLSVPVTTAPNDCNEVLYATTYNTQPVIVNSSEVRVSLAFNHALAWFNYQCKIDNTPNMSAKFVGAQFNSNIYTSGNLLIDELGTKNWANHISWGSLNNASNFGVSRNIDLTTSYSEIYNTVIMPQEAPDSIAVIYDIEKDSADHTLYFNGKKSLVPLHISDFESGQKYVVKHIITGSNIFIDGVTWDNYAHVPNAYVNHSFFKGYYADNKKFSYNILTDLDFANGDYVEAQIDLTVLNRAKQNIISFGEDIGKWAPNAKNGNERYNLHIYFPNDNNDKRLRFSAVTSGKVNNYNRRTMGIIKPSVFTFDPDTNHFVTIRFDKYGFYVNGHLITRDDFVSVEASKTPELPNNPSGVYPDVWTYPDYFMPYFQNSTVTLQVGSEEGSTRSYATYNYIMYHHVLK